MAIRKVINKLTHTTAIAKVVNDLDASGTVTIGLQTDLLKSNESIIGGVTPRVSIKRIEWTVADQTGSILIKRNGVVTHRLHSSTALDLGYGLDSEGNQYDIEVTMTGGTLILVVDKVEGYLPNFQPELHGGE